MTNKGIIIYPAADEGSMKRKGGRKERMKRLIAGGLALLMLMAMSTGFGLTYSVDPSSGLYVDENGNTIAEYWDDQAGIYIVDGVAYAIENTDTSSSSESSGATETSSTGSESYQNPDGGMTVTSSDQTGAFDSNAAAAQQEEESTDTGTASLTPEEWRARMEKAMKANGVNTGTMYVDESGAMFAVEVVYVGLGRSEVILEGKNVMVPTSSLVWETEAPPEKRLAIVTPTKQSYITMRAKMSKKAFVMEHCEKCRVVRVISTGNTWTMVDDNGLRGYVLTSGLTFYSNDPREYRTGVITFRGKTTSRNMIHVRSSNKNSSRQLAEFACGTPLTIFEHDEKWCEVDVGGWHCYILSEFVTMDEVPLSAASQNQSAEP